MTVCKRPRQVEFENIQLRGEHVAEFSYRPTACKKAYRVVVVWKDLDVLRGQQWLFDDTRCFFYITNKHRRDKKSVLTMDFATFRNAFINIPTQIITTGRKIVCRILSWNPWQPVFFRMLDRINTPLRC